MPTPTVTLACDGQSVVLPAPMPQYELEHERVQAVGQTASGERYFYDKGVVNRAVALVFEVTAADKAAFLSFVDSVLRGGLNEFTYTDHLGGVHAGCRLRSPSPQIRKLRSSRFRIRIEFITTDDVD